VGTLVVTDGADRLRDGAKVEVVKQDPSTQSSGSAQASPSAAQPSSARTSPGPSSSKPASTDAERAKTPKAEAPNTAGAMTPQAPAQTAEVGAERPRWMDRFPPDMVEKIKAMSPEERRAFFQKMRERRQAQGGDQ
jgi:multidrug efflux system membrane fusion protein